MTVKSCFLSLTCFIDKLKGVCYNYTYDEYGDVIKVEERKTSNNSLVGTQTVTYDDSRRQISRTDSRVSQTYETLYERTIGNVGNIFPDNAVIGVTFTGKFTDTVDRDGLRRPSVRKLTLNSASSPLMTDTYGYLARTGGGTTSYVSSLSNTVGNSTSSLSYTYNNSGNITEIRENGTLKYKYTYDSLNRLTREDNYDAGVSYTWTYGCSTKGNLECKTKYLRNSSDTEWVQSAQTNYSYNSAWKDALTSFGSETITYDAIGNPTTYRGKALTWTNVRRLASFGSNTFLYGADGIRYKKNNITYTLDGNRILKETDGTKTLTYYYGTSGVIGFRYNGADYYYRKNLQGDVIAIFNTSGTKVASYVYNAWAKFLRSQIIPQQILVT